LDVVRSTKFFIIVVIASASLKHELLPANSQAVQPTTQPTTIIQPPVQRPWPPVDASGRVMMGPKKNGTTEQVGWPMYGWSKADKERYMSYGLC
jgi:hypothetical protein